MAAGQEDSKLNDPFEAFREVRDSYLESLSKVMISAVNTEEYARSTGAMLDSYLTLSAPIRESLDKAMVRALEQLSLPSRQQVAALAERFTNIEMRLDDLDAKLDRVIELSSAANQPAAVIPPVAGGVTTARERSSQHVTAGKS